MRSWRTELEELGSRRHLSVADKARRDALGKELDVTERKLDAGRRRLRTLQATQARVTTRKTSRQ